MRANTRELHPARPLPSLLVIPALMVAVAFVVAYAYLRQPMSPVARERATLTAQLRAYAGWEREHPHQCLVPLPDPLAVGNRHYGRRAEWFLADRGAAALLAYRAWFRATYAAEHPAGDRYDRYLVECTPAAVLAQRAWLDRYLTTRAAGR